MTEIEDERLRTLKAKAKAERLTRVRQPRLSAARG